MLLHPRRLRAPYKKGHNNPQDVKQTDSAVGWAGLCRRPDRDFTFESMETMCKLNSLSLYDTACNSVGGG